MSKKTDEKKALKKGTSKFNLVGEAKVGSYTFKLNEESQKSDWIYNMMNLGVDCGNGNTVYADLMGGYGSERDNIIYVHGKKPNIDEETKEPKKDGKGNVLYTDDFDNQFTIDWDDRDNEEILDTIGDLCFITVGLEQTESNKKKESHTVYEKFLSAYDAIEYISEHLEDGMVINVSGNLKYSPYEENTSIKKEITSIALSKATPDKYHATFQQTILIDKNSVEKLDTETNTYPVSARVIDYIKKVNDEGKEIFKGNAPFYVTYLIDNDNPDNPNFAKAFIDNILKVKKDITELGVEGDIIEGSSLVEITDDDLDDETKMYLSLGIITEEDVKKHAVGNKREHKWIIRKPIIRNVKSGDSSKIVAVKTEQKYTENDLDVMPFVEANETPYDNDNNSDSKEEDSDDNKWMDELLNSDNDE